MRPPIRFLGAGGAHDLQWGNSSALLEWEGRTFLLDCGFTVYPRLVEKQLIERVDAVCITHLHDDHIGSLSVFLYHRHFLSQLPPLPLIVGTPELYAKLHTILHFMMGEVERFARLVFPQEYAAFVQAIPTSRLHASHMPSCAYLFSSPAMHLLYSGDIAEPVPVLNDPAWLASHQPLWVFHDVAFRRTPSHCYYEALYPWLESTQLWGYHCDPAEAPRDNRIPLVHEVFFMGRER
ncbi:MAG: MBL fold metallo-hydrolase [Bacteroidia bacterium]|nr:MBL fold metallo-hydrolase [Bacteroidia bacterium]